MLEWLRRALATGAATLALVLPTPGDWSAAGGSAAGDGVTTVPAPAGEPEHAWRVAFRGELEGEPLVLGDRVVVALADSASRRRLAVLDLATGRRLDQRGFSTDLPLAPAAHGDVLVVRSGRGELEFLRLAGDRLRLGRAVSGRRVSPAVFDERGLALSFVDDALVALHPDEVEPRWRVAGGWRGTPAARGEDVFAVTYERGVAKLASIDARTGAVRVVLPVGDHGGAVPGLDDVGPRVVALEDALWIRYDRPLRSNAPERVHDTARVARLGGGALDERVTLHALVHDPVAVPEGTLLLERLGDARRCSVHLAALEDQLRVVADEARATDLLDAPVAARAGDLLLLGRNGVDADDLEVRFRLPVEPLARPVPVPHGVLVRTGARTLEAFRAAPTPDPDRARAAQLEATLDARVAQGLAALAKLATESADAALVERLVRAAEDGGDDSRALSDARRALERWRHASGPAIVRARVVDEVREKERALLEAGDRELVQLARGRPTGVRHALLASLLERRPDHPEALAALAADLPTDAPDAFREDPLGWLALAGLAARAELTFVGGPGTGDTARVRLATERGRWRADLVAVETPRLVLVAPPTVPTALANAVRLGEEVCRALDEIFDVRDAEPEPLQVLVHTDRVSYQAFAGSSLSAWAAGHYDPNEHVSHLFVPDETDALERFRSTYVHELTHHWVAGRAPFVRRTADRAGRPDAPGFWVCEGFASMLEEFRFDVERGTWSSDDPRAASLDVLASCDEAELLPWDEVLRMSQEDFLALDAHAHRTFPRRWILGGAASLTDKKLYYLQAAGVAHWLFRADGGTHRAELLELLRAWYTDDVDAGARTVAAGLTPRQLGDRVVRWARELADDTGRSGSRPAPAGRRR